MADFRIPKKYMTPFGGDIEDAEAVAKLQWLCDRLPMTKKQIVKRALIKYYEYHLKKSFPQDLKEAKEVMLTEQNQECFYCHKLLLLKDATIDHKKPLARGGTHELSNLCAACHHCNNLKSHMTVEEYRDFMISSAHVLKSIREHATS